MSFLGSSMSQLPEDTVVDILSRLPAKTILHCRCVCKFWYTLLTNSTYFINLHLSRSPTGLIIHHNPTDLRHIRGDHDPGFLKLVEIEDEPNYHNLRYDPTMTLDLNLGACFKSSKLLLVGSVNGLVCLWQYEWVDNTYICNPITREYLVLPRQQYYRQQYNRGANNARIFYGFGVSSLTGEYKVVRVFQGDTNSSVLTSPSRPRLSEGEVYTLGTGKWRSLGRVPYCLAEFRGPFHGPFLNGHVHWLVCDEDAPEYICSFDLETESFQLFPSPPTMDGYLALGVLGGCLSKNSCTETEFVIWVMKEYGIKESWTKQILITSLQEDIVDCLMCGTSYVIKVLKDGTILMIWCRYGLFEFGPERMTFESPWIFTDISGMTYVPSFIRLRNFELENFREF